MAIKVGDTVVIKFGESDDLLSKEILFIEDDGASLLIEFTDEEYKKYDCGWDARHLSIEGRTFLKIQGVIVPKRWFWWISETDFLSPKELIEKKIISEIYV